MMNYLNKYIRPHSLISISIFEQSHGSWMHEDDPTSAREWIVPLHAVICHEKDSDGYKDIFNSSNIHLKHSDESPIYRCEVTNVTDWS